MNRNMKQWAADLIAAPTKKPMPLLSFPCVQLMGVTVEQLVNSSALQAEGMKRVADRISAAASVSLMDLSVEAEAFGAQVRFSQDEVPAIIGQLVSDEEEANDLAVPDLSAGRAQLCVDAVRRAKAAITDKPLLAGMIGPYSLAGYG